MAQLSNKGRAALSAKATEQKSNGTCGQFGHRNNAVSNNANSVLDGPGNPRDTHAMEQAFASEPEAVGRPFYDPTVDAASLDVENVFGVQARVCYNYSTKKFMATIHRPELDQVFGAPAEAFMDGLTGGADGVERTAPQAFELFKELATGSEPKPAAKPSPRPARKTAKTAAQKKPQGYKVPEERRRYLSAEDVAGIESGAIPLGADERIANGEVFDKVYDAELGMMFHRADSDKGIYPISDCYTMRFQTSRDITEDERSHISKLVGACWVLSGTSEGCDWPEQAGTDNSFTIYADSTKSSGYPPAKVVDYLGQYMAEGTPMRPRKGNTRWTEAFPDPDLKVEIYFDSRVTG